MSGNYGVSLILFTLLSRIILLPISFIAYKNSIRMAKIKPRLNDIKKHFSGDKDRIANEQIALYKAEKYSPLMDMLPLVIQLLFIIGLIHVMYNPMQYLLRMPRDVIEQLLTSAAQISGVESLGAAAQLNTISIIQNPVFASSFEGMFPEWLSRLQQFDMRFLGMNLGIVPSIAAFYHILGTFSKFLSISL